MPQHVSAREITVETRTKLGEILVKVTRTLGISYYTFLLFYCNILL